MHPGSEKISAFRALFDENFLLTEINKIIKEHGWPSIKIHSEAYVAGNTVCPKHMDPILNLLCLI